MLLETRQASFCLASYIPRIDEGTAMEHAKLTALEVERAHRAGKRLLLGQLESERRFPCRVRIGTRRALLGGRVLRCGTRETPYAPRQEKP